MEALLVSTAIVALAEIGDKTQLLALLLASRFRKPMPIIAGILFATIANHALAGLTGAWIAQMVSPETLRWIIGLSFLAFGLWALIPDKLEEGEVQEKSGRGVFLTTLVTFFLVEIGDKTQIATVALAAQFDQLVLVVVGTTLGMMLANVPMVILGNKAAERIPAKLMRAVTAVSFAGMGIAAFMGVGG